MANLPRVAVLISGSGSNLQALIDACSSGAVPATIALVISNKAEAYGLTRAANAKIECRTISHTEYASREQFDAALHEALMAANIDYVCLAGFMRLLTADFVDQWRGKMINIHPSLLPQYKGANAIQEAFEAKESITGCTVHHVIPEMDAGEIILQEEVPILPDDTFDTLAKRIHAAEHRIYPNALAQLVVSKATSA